jgi:hypothetical protein
LSDVPPGLESFLPVFPALKPSTPSRQNRACWGPRRWATIGRPSGAVFSAISRRRTWDRALQKTKGGHAALARLLRGTRTRPALTPFGTDSTDPRGPSRGKAGLAGPESRERWGSPYNNPFPVARVRWFCSDFVTAAPDSGPGRWPGTAASAHSPDFFLSSIINLRRARLILVW